MAGVARLKDVSSGTYSKNSHPSVCIGQLQYCFPFELPWSIVLRIAETPHSQSGILKFLGNEFEADELDMDRARRACQLDPIVMGSLCRSTGVAEDDSGWWEAGGR